MMTEESKTNFSPYGKHLLKQLKGDPRHVNPTPKAVERWGIDRSDSVFNVLPEEFRTQVLVLPDELLEKKDEELEHLMDGVTRQDRRVRIHFWDEYERANRGSRLMDFSVVVQETGLPSWEIYEQQLYQSQARLAWLMRPPASYQLTMREAHEISLNRLTEILSLPLVEEYVSSKGKVTNRVNVGVGLLILQAIKLVDNRRMGAPTQKNVNVQVDAGSAPVGGTLNMEEVNRRLRELAEQMGEKIPGITDVPHSNEKPPEKEVTSDVES